MPSQNALTARTRLQKLKRLERELVVIQKQFNKAKDASDRDNLRRRYQEKHGEWLSLKFPSVGRSAAGQNPG